MLVQYILVSLLPGESGITSPEEAMFIQFEDGTTHLEVQVGGNRAVFK